MYSCEETLGYIIFDSKGAEFPSVKIEKYANEYCSLIGSCCELCPLALPALCLLFHHTYAGCSVLTQVCISHDHPGSYVTCRFPHARLPQIAPFRNVSTRIQHDGVHALHGSQPLRGRRETSAACDSTQAAGEEVWTPCSAIQLLSSQPCAWE